ncbi:MAG: T9SS type A sorting domain-containing protein [Candidatus Eisenbacteria bacterium]|nr:T9SS type A sorting domain-containing protein [Candidatus Eisenbacteria bacterium]
MMARNHLVELCLFWLLAGGTWSVAVPATWYILPDGTGDAPTVAAGIDAAASGDTVLVGCGTYFEHDITMKDGVVLLGETGDPECVVINAQQQGRVLYGTSLGSSTIIAGLTLTGGLKVEGTGDERYGGAIYFNDFSGTLAHCRIVGNEAVNGGGVLFWSGCPIVEHCTFWNNWGRDYGGGLNANHNLLTLRYCTFVGNRAIANRGSCVSLYSSEAIIENTIFAYSLELGEITCTSSFFLSACLDCYGNAGGDYQDCLYDHNGINGNISADPLFCDLDDGDFHLADVSPCAPEMNPACGFIGAYEVGCAGYGIRSITDVPNDQGRQVRLWWNDFVLARGDTVVTHFSIWRRIDGDPQGAGFTARSVSLAYPPGNWDYVMTVPAYGEDEYNVVCPTLCDSTIAEGMCWSTFFVRAGTEFPEVYFDTEPDSGYSVDNLTPGIPGNLRFEGDHLLAWNESQDEDFDYFSVYGSETGDLGDAVLIGQTVATEMDVSGASHSYYHATATDFAGNEGDPATIQSTAGIPGSGSIPNLSLGPIRPNPSRSALAINFELPQDGTVFLSVYDVSGRLVRYLLRETRKAGHHRVVWLSNDDAGRPVAPGLYVVRVEIDAGAVERKVTVLD